MASFEGIIDSISDSSKKSFKGQVSMFDLGGETEEENNLEKMKYSFTTLKEYSDKELLSMEKEMLGIYISGHPLAGLKEQIEKLTDINTLKIREGLDELEETGKFPFKDGQNVKFAGIINSIKKKYTKNNKLMAFVTLEDLYGTMEVIVFENAYQASVNSLLEENVVLVEGRLSIREEEENVTLIASKVTSFDAIGTFNNASSVPFASHPTSRKSLTINITNLTEEQKDKLRGALKFFTGDRNNTAVKIINGEKEAPAGGIFANELITNEIKEIVGKENIQIL